MECKKTQQHIEQRADISDHYPINFPPAFYQFDNQCIIDQHGDDLLGDRLKPAQLENGQLIFDRFRICLTSKTLEYNARTESDNDYKSLGSLDDNWIQSNYDWRYSVFEGGFYYWLYEHVTVNIISINSVDKDVFINTKPKIIVNL